MRRAVSSLLTGLPNALFSGMFALMLCAVAGECLAQPRTQAPAGSVNAGAVNAAEAGPKWTQLTTAQRSALTPLERDWSTIDADRKQKWLQIAGRMPSMPRADRERVQARMTEWARMSPQQRGQARLAYEQARQVGPKDRKAEWDAYQALPAEQREQLQARAARPAHPSSAAKTGTGPRNEKSQAKSNIVTVPAYGGAPKPVAPTIVQAQPGATTSLMSRRPNPPAHQQTGLPKIAATPEFVDKRTLLPRRGPQAAATRSAAASAPEQQHP